MNKTKNIMLRIRVEPEFKAKLQEAVKQGLAESMSALIRTAVNKLLDKQAESS